MAIEDQLYAFLVGSSSLTALVGTRIEPIQNAQGTTFPRLVFTKTEDAPIYASSGATSLKRCVFTIESQARDVASAESVSAVVKTLVSGLKGNVNNSFSQRTGINNEYDIIYPPAGGEETVVVGKVVEIETYYT